VSDGLLTRSWNEPPSALRSRHGATTVLSWCVGAGCTTAAVAAVCWIEARVARNGPQLCGTPPASDGRHGHGDGAPLRILWLGDSLAVGVGVDEPHEVPAAQLAHHLAHPCDVQLRAVAGATTADVLDVQLAGIDTSTIDVVVVQVGANDVACMVGRRRFRTNYRRILAAVEGRPVVCVGIPDFAAAERLAEPLRSIAGARGRMLDAIIRAESRAAGAAYVDISSRPAHLDRPATRALLSPDRYHPGPSGYSIWAVRIADSMRALALSPVAA
jgi:lysophospholipase L1-like esterase